MRTLLHGMLLAAGMVAATLTGCRDQERTADPSVVHIGGGTLRGIVVGDTVAFRGVPYAAPPVGERRFAPPAAAARWSGLRDATRFAATCPQGQETSEDCLYVNVTTPRSPARAKLPVMVWLHGGGFSAGTPNSYDASELAAQGEVIVVGVAFRINVFGLFALPGMEGSGSLMLLDQQAALRWVQRNIAAFGGDPGNVTLFGESGGAIGTCAQLVSPSARGLFHKAILQSGSCSTSFAANFVASGVPAGRYFMPRSTTEAQGLTLAKAAGCAASHGRETLACLRRLPAATIAAAGAPFFSASYGTPTLPTEPQAALDAGDFQRLPILTGFTEKEGLAMVAGMQLGGKPVTVAEYNRLAVDAFADRAAAVLARYPLDRYEGRGDLAWAAIITDRMFACAQLQDAARLARHAPVYAYEFADPNGVGLVPVPAGLPRGPSHSSELPLLFRLADGPLDIATGRKIERTPAQRRLSADMIAAWSRFASNGDPSVRGREPWPRLASDGPLAVRWLTTAGSPGPSANAGIAHQCAFWSTSIENPPSL